MGFLENQTSWRIRVDILKFQAVLSRVGTIVVDLHVALLMRQQVTISALVALLAGPPREHSATEVARARASQVAGNKLVLVEQVQFEAAPAPAPLACWIIGNCVVSQQGSLLGAAVDAHLRLLTLDDELTFGLSEGEGARGVRQAAFVDDDRWNLV